jgi:hypothetical protein
LRTGNPGKQKSSDGAFDLPTHPVSGGFLERIGHICSSGFRQNSKIGGRDRMATIAHAGQVLVKTKRAQSSDGVLGWEIVSEDDREIGLHLVSGTGLAGRVKGFDRQDTSRPGVPVPEGWNRVRLDKPSTFTPRSQNTLFARAS